MIDPMSSLIRWADKQIKQTSGPPRAYTGPYPNLDGPTCAQMDAVAQLAEFRRAGKINPDGGER